MRCEYRHKRYPTHTTSYYTAAANSYLIAIQDRGVLSELSRELSELSELSDSYPAG